MSKTAAEIVGDAMRLSIGERAEIAAGLLASLDGEPDEDVEEAWAREIELRVQRIQSGTASSRLWRDVKHDLEMRRPR